MKYASSSGVASSPLDQLASVAVGYPIPYRDLPRHPRWSWLRTAWWSIRLLQAFEQGGMKQAYQLLQRCLCSQQNEGDSAPLRLLQARQAQTVLRAWIHLVGRAHQCLAESFALCAGLRCLGFDCHLFVGYAQIEQYVQFPTHAWVDYLGEPVNDALEVKYAYHPLFCDGIPVNLQKEEI